MVRIRLLYQVWRLRSPRWFDSKKMNSDSECLCDLNTDPYVFIARQYQGIANCLVSCQLDEISYDQRIYTLLLALTVHHPEAELDVRRIGNFILFRRRAVGARKSVVPVDPEKSRLGGSFLSLLGQLLKSLLDRQPNRFPPLFLAGEQGRTLGKQIARIDKYRDLQQAGWLHT